MKYSLQPVDVIFLSDTEGNIQPLRIRASEGREHAVVGNITEILHREENGVFGAEVFTFLCRVHVDGAVNILELKYFIRTHRWFISLSET